MNVYVVTADEYNNAGHTAGDILNYYISVFKSKKSAQDYVNKQCSESMLKSRCPSVPEAEWLYCHEPRYEYGYTFGSVIDKRKRYTRIYHIWEVEI